MSKLYIDILDKNRQKIFSGLEKFSSVGALGGGTALALQINHRKSFDFDILTDESIKRGLLEKVRQVFGEETELLVDSGDELSFLTPNKVKISFIYFPFEPLHEVVKTPSISIFDIKDLASNKAYVIGRRGEYRDYVDLFFLLKKGLKLEEIIKEAKRRFKGGFSEKLFLEQLIYFGDLEDFTVEFVEEEYSPEQILNFFEEAVSKYAKSRL